MSMNRNCEQNWALFVCGEHFTLCCHEVESPYEMVPQKEQIDTSMNRLAEFASVEGLNYRMFFIC